MQIADHDADPDIADSLRKFRTVLAVPMLLGGRPIKAFNPVARPEYELLVAPMSGEHAVHGFANRDLRAKLAVIFVLTRHSRVPRSAASSTATSTGSSRRSPTRAAGA